MKNKRLHSIIETGSRQDKALGLLLSFFLPLIVMLGALAGLGVAPFGDHTLLISDANGYYINTLSYAGRMLKGLEGLTYSFEKGLGGNMTGHLNGILLTPFAFLLSFTDITRYPAAYTFISVLNLSLGGLTMYLFLADRLGHKRSHLIFSTAYALMGFNVSNVFQAVFFCAAPVLPLMAIGLRRLIQGKNPLLYILSIAWGLLSNAYFGFALCVASVLFFLVEFVLGWKENEGKRLRLFLHYALSSLCGGLLVIVFWLPGFLSLRGGRLEQTDISSFSFVERQPLLEIGSKLFLGANSTAELVNGHPNLYVGLLPVLLCLLFFADKGVDRKKKLAAGVLFGVYLLSFTVLAFDMLMHAGTTTNWFNFRYSYVFSFLMLAVAATEWERLDELPAANIRRAFVVMLLATIVIFARRYDYVYAGEVLLDYLFLLLIGLALWLHRRKPEENPKGIFELVTLLLVCITLFLNYRICTKNIRDWEKTETDYQTTVMAVDPLVEAVQTADKSFYRMEVNRQRSGTCGNDPMLYGYNGVGHGGSNERNFVRTELNKLGIPWFDNRAFYADGVPAATDALLGLKYVIAEEDLTEEKGYERRVELLGWALYENPDALPIVMLSAGSLDGVETGFASVFDNLNRTWIAVGGAERPVFFEEDEISFRAHNLSDALEMDAASARETMAKLDRQALEPASDSRSTDTNVVVPNRTEAPKDCACIEYSFTATRDGPVYVYERNSVTDIGQSTVPSVGWLGNYAAGDTVTGYIRTSLTYITPAIMDELCGRFRVAYADPDALHELSAAIAARPITVEKLRDNHLVGSYTAEEGQVLFLTIPWDEGWTLTVDGEKTPLHKVLGVLMAAEIPAGTHSYELRFVPAGLRAGACISAVTLAFTVLYVIFGGKAIDRIMDERAKKRRAAAERKQSEQAEKTTKESEHDTV